jgi:hypothetical protein
VHGLVLECGLVRVEAAGDEIFEDGVAEEL